MRDWANTKTANGRAQSVHRANRHASDERHEKEKEREREREREQTEERQTKIRNAHRSAVVASSRALDPLDVFFRLHKIEHMARCRVHITSFIQIYEFHDSFYWNFSIELQIYDEPNARPFQLRSDKRSSFCCSTLNFTLQRKFTNWFS